MNRDHLKRLDGFDNCIIGHTVNAGGPILVYCMDKMLTVLEEENGMEPEEANEYFWFNVAGAYFGPDTPIIICQDEGDYFQNEINNLRP
jgi:hypothetical protein